MGKTTLALHLAAALCAQGQRVLYVDADPQGTALGWSSARMTPAPFPIVALPSDTLHRELPRIGEGFDHAIIDGAPRLEKLTRSAVAAADVVLIPAQPSGPDIWAAAGLMEIVGEAQIMKPWLQAAVVVMRLRSATALGRAALGILADQPIPTLTAHVHDRIAYAEAVTSARTVFESHPRGVAVLAGRGKSCSVGSDHRLEAALGNVSTLRASFGAAPDDLWWCIPPVRRAA